MQPYSANVTNRYQMKILDPYELGHEIRIRRRGLNLTQDQLAEVIGVNRRVVGELERGKGSVRLEIALAAARAIGLDVELRARER
jgi:HTH-type transcriptional regulator / antitoxin HipB